MTSNGTIINNGTVTVEEGGTCTNNGSLDCNHHFGGTATCTEKAKCGLCGAEFGDFLPHSLTKTEAKAPTCTEVGNEAYWTCETCGKYFSDAESKTEIILDSTVLPALGHDYKDGVCTRCEGKDPDYVPPTDPEAPAQTGESALLPLMAVLMIFSAAALLWTARKKQQF